MRGAMLLLTTSLPKLHNEVRTTIATPITPQALDVHDMTFSR